MGRCRSGVDHFVNLGSAYSTQWAGGTNKELSETQKRVLLRKARSGDGFASSLRSDLQLPVTVRRVQQILSKDEHLVYTKRVAKPSLKPHHKLARLDFARQFMHWTSEWQNVLFSDEKKFNLDDPDGFQNYWHDLRREKSVRMSRNFGGGTVTIWAAFGSRGKSKISWISTKMKANDYVEVLECELIRLYEEIDDENLIFQQDNASIHSAKVTKEWFQRKEINVLPWPAVSPDLNPIENLWGVLARRVYKDGRQFRTVKELKDGIREAWASINENLMRNLVESMPRRIFAVI